MSHSIARQIAGLHRLGVPQLKQRWRDLFGKEPPAYNRAFLIKRLAYPQLRRQARGGPAQDVSLAAGTAGRAGG